MTSPLESFNKIAGLNICVQSLQNFVCKCKRNIKTPEIKSIFLFNFVYQFSRSQSSLTLCDNMNCSVPGFSVLTNSWSLLKLISIELVMPSNHLILCRPLLILLSVFPSIVVFSNESVLHIRWPKYWSFSFSISPSNEYSGLIFFMIDWLDILVVQGTLKSLLQHHSSKASILCHQLSLWSNSHIHT